jgi:tetratricopeptide (TPR) repeat protein
MGRFFPRKSLYPATTLDLPSGSDVNEIIRSQLSVSQDHESSIAVCNDMAHVIWRRNKDKYPFYLEEGLPMPWTYSHALPAGQLLELKPEELHGIPKEVVAADTEFWNAKIRRLENDPILRSNENARMMLANSRVSIGNVYRHHGMTADARRAYHEALTFWPPHASALGSFLDTLDLTKERETAKKAIREALKMDSRNRALLNALEVLDSMVGNKKTQ